jgi:hypothetical protein
MSEWLPSVTSLIGAAVILVFTYLGARRLGLTDLQKAVRMETDSLVGRLKDRVAMLEQENRGLHIEVANLQSEARTMRVRIDELEEALANVAVRRRRQA